jgi:nucleotidyltransferase/DNA polymerase involved in DNA repair|tara:strand:+ start:519 stop:1121 length:603 start_codon:yes stop_codon:yes gene_type:complete
MLDIFEDTIGDSALDLELDAIKGRMSEMLTLLLTRLYRSKHPKAGEEEINSFVQENNTFTDENNKESESLEEDITSLEKLLSEMLASYGEMVERVESTEDSPKYNGRELKSKSNDVSKTPPTKKEEVAEGEEKPTKKEKVSTITKGGSAPEYGGSKKISRRREVGKKPTEAVVMELFDKIKDDIEALKGRHVSYRRRAIL